MYCRFRGGGFCLGSACEGGLSGDDECCGAGSVEMLEFYVPVVRGVGFDVAYYWPSLSGPAV